MASLVDAKSANLPNGNVLPFDEFVERALYDPDLGFYSRAGGPTRRRDFLTSASLGPLFGAVLARALDTWWRDLGAPEVFHVIEAGAGDGALAKAILRARPDCRAALRYVAVERSDALRRLHPANIAPLAKMPAPVDEGIVLANELLDNLPFRLLQRAGSGWDELHVSDSLEEALLPARPETADQATRLAPGAPPGSRIPLQDQAAAWLRAALATLRRGRVVVIDYADTTHNFATRPWGEWVRTYRANGPGAGPLRDVGTQDITCEVAVDQLASIRPLALNRSQADFLRTHGLDDLVAEARQEWQARAHIGDLAALKHKARLSEAAALTDPAGLGAFRVLEWIVSAE